MTSSPQISSGAAPQRRGLRLWWVLLLVALATPFFALVIQPWLQRAAEVQAMGHAHAFMLEILRAERDLLAAAAIDQDADGVGEYGFLRELTGEWSARLAGKSPPRRLKLPADAVRTALPDGEVLQADGYCFRIYLPMGSAPACVDPVAPPQPMAASANEQETRFAVYCWPARPTAQARCLYGCQAMDPDFCCGGLAMRSGGNTEYLGVIRVPSAGAALTAMPGEDTAYLQGQQVSGTPATDGAFWLEPG